MIAINNLVVEVTRKCNMKCSHCLRGGAQNKNIDKRYIDRLFEQVSVINDITFTGGEPTMNVEAIAYFLEQAKKRNVEIGNFYIATNGKKVTLDFIVTALKLYAYCWNKEMCSVQVSNDIYHNEEGEYNDELLQGLSFYSKKNENDYKEYYLINQGRAKTNGRGRRDLEDEISEIETREDFYDATIYLNCNGEIINGCDWSYTDQKKNILCNIDNLQEYFNSLEE